MKALAAEAGGDVTFAGYVSGERLHQLIGEAKALVLPSEWYENAPISILEAYALGVPVIGADIGGIPEMIIESETGMVSRTGDIDDLARVLGDFARLTRRRGARWERQAACGPAMNSRQRRTETGRWNSMPSWERFDGAKR